jgi:hypothetical protein
MAGFNELDNETFGFRTEAVLIPEQMSNVRLIRVKLFSCSDA